MEINKIKNNKIIFLVIIKFIVVLNNLFNQNACVFTW